MANLYRKPIVVTDPKTGAKLKSLTKKWWGQYKDANGRLRRHPLSIDKVAAQAMLNDLVKQVEREKAGLVDPTERHRKRPLTEHLAEFERFKRNREVGEKQVSEVMRQLRLLVARCKWHSLADISAGSLLNVLGASRKPRADGAIKGWSAQTYNHYLGAARQFTRWLVRDRRLPSDPLSDVSKLNTAADRRHDRRALTYDEFSRLTAAAKSGKSREGISGPDRAMLYVLAGWTGFRKGELGSLTKASFRLDDSPPTVTVAAAYSKRRRQDTQILHPEVVGQLREWLARKAELAPTDLLFPISARAGGLERDVGNMVQKDLSAARKAWLKEAKDEADREKREQSDFLSYRNHAGLFADFHSLRHFFITNLERSGVSPRMAQALARHSDIRLTLGVYTHVALHDQVGAIEALPGPASSKSIFDRIAECPGIH